MKIVYHLYLEIWCSQAISKIFRSFPSSDLRWLLTSTRTIARDIINPYTKYEKHPSFLFCDIVFTNFSVLNLWWLYITRYPKCYKYALYQCYPSWHIIFVSSSQNSPLNWPLLTSGNLRPPPKAIGYFLSMWWIHLPSTGVKRNNQCYLEISCLQGFQFGDLKWPLTSINNYRIFSLSIAKLYITYEKYPIAS